ncbi:hypothetical protein HCA21_14640, partial [Listeria seeligeri]|uniref:hypothetical protein n=1 Tax=Listeria seeligeri TaxID=1640 RepID=UPI001627E0EF
MTFFWEIQSRNFIILLTTKEKNIVDYSINVDEILKAKNTPEIGVLRKQLEAYDGKFSNEYKSLSVKEYAEGFSSALFQPVQANEPSKPEDMEIEQKDVTDKEINEMFRDFLGESKSGQLEILRTFNLNAIASFTVTERDHFSEEAKIHIIDGLKELYKQADKLDNDVVYALTTSVKNWNTSLHAVNYGDTSESYQYYDQNLKNDDNTIGRAKVSIENLTNIQLSDNSAMAYSLSAPIVKTDIPVNDLKFDSLEDYYQSNKDGNTMIVNQNLDDLGVIKGATEQPKKENQGEESNISEVSILKMKLNDKGQGIA